jgi:hypothetical protein
VKRPADFRPALRAAGPEVQSGNVPKRISVMAEANTAATKTKTAQPATSFGLPHYEIPKFDLPKMEMPEAFP